MTAADDPTASPPPGDELAGRRTRTEVPRSGSSLPGRGIGQVLTEIPGGAENCWHSEEVGYMPDRHPNREDSQSTHPNLHTADGFLILPSVSYIALDVGPDTGQMVSTSIVDPARPLATRPPD